MILETRETARGLIMNVPDVLFNSGSATLTTPAREKLARVAGILATHPDLHVAVEGHTDNVGSVSATNDCRNGVPRPCSHIWCSRRSP